MGNYKDANGKTRIGSFLDKAAPTLLKGLGTAVKTFTGLDISSVTNAILGSSELTETDKETALALLELDKAELHEISERWKADATSDSWLSKNVRPIIVLYLLFITSLFCLLDSIDNNFTVRDNWIELLSYLLGITIFAYFGSRGGEKIMKIIKR